MPLSALTRRGLAILATHHPPRDYRRWDRWLRALLGHVDISIEMRHPAGDPVTRRRRLLALSRHAATPRQLLLELNGEGSDYVLVADDEDDDFQASWEALWRAWRCGAALPVRARYLRN